MMPDSLPNVDDLLNQHSPGLPDVDDLLSKHAPPPKPGDVDEFGRVTPGAMATGEDADAYYANSSVGHVLNSIGQGVHDGWGAGALGIGPETEAALKRAGIFNDLQAGQHSLVRSFNEALIRPAASGLDAVLRAGNAALQGGIGGVASAAGETVSPEFGRGVGGLLEAATLDAGSGIHIEPRAPTPVGAVLDMLKNEPQFIDRAASAGVIGQTEGAWKGVEPLRPQTFSLLNVPVRADLLEPLNVEANKPTAQPVAPEPTDIHGMARKIAPDTFKQFDTLSEQRDALREQVATAQDNLRKEAEAQNPNASQIADLQIRIDTMTPKMEAKYGDDLRSRIDDLRSGFADQMEMLTRDTPEITAMRQQMLELDYQMRDLSPDVSAAYREAESRMPVREEPAAAEPAPAQPEPATQAPVEEPAQKPARAAPEPLAATAQAEPAPPAELTPEAAKPPFSIAEDAAQKLQAAGRSEDESRAVGALLQSHYEARAARLEGLLGSAEDLYRREAPDVLAGESGGRGGMAAGKLRIRADGRATITLFAKADASTFLHETGHQWLEELMRDAAHDAAPAALKADAATVRTWLKAGDGEAITGRQHERFARAFERYLMEGRAPTSALADVFAKFRDWLTKIYQTVDNLRSPITPDIRDVFDRLVSTAPDPRETVLAPEKPRELINNPRSAYDRVPPEPERLVSFLVRRGGLRDVGGEIRQMIGGVKGRPGLINMKRGLHMDDAALQAWENGYFPDHGETRPTINDLIDKIEADLKMSPQYSAHDVNEAQAYHEALERNAEIERLSYEHGISPMRKSREQFFDEVRAKMAQDAEPKRDEMGGDATELASHARDVNEDPFGHSMLDDIPDDEGPDDGISQAGGRIGDEAGQRDIAGSAGVGGGEAVGQDGAGQSGRGAGSGRRDSEAPGGERSAAGTGIRSEEPDPAVEQRPTPVTDAPGSPNERFGEPASGLTDKAGNIRLDNLNQPEDVLHAIREAAAENDDFTQARRGVVSDAEVFDLADSLGMRPGDLSLRQVGQAFNAEQIVAARKLLIETATRTRDAMIKAATGSEADVLAYGRAKALHRMVQEQVAGITAEAGRALRAFRMLEGEQDIAAVNQFVKQATGRDLFQLRQEAQAGAALETPAQVSKFVNDMSAQTRWQRARSQIISYFINNLISGPITHAAYGVGNTMSALFKAGVTTPVAAAIDTLRGASGPDRVYLGEAGAQLYGLARGMRDGFVPGWEAFKSGVPFMKGEELRQGSFADAFGDTYRPQVIPGMAGRILEAPGRMVSAIHVVFYGMNYEAEIARQAYRQASAEGLDGEAFNARVADLSQSPPMSMVERAHQEALSMVLMGRPRYGTMQQKVADLINSNIILKLAMPFVQIGTNIVGEGLVKHSPLAVLSEEARADLAGTNGQVARSTQMAKIGVGTGLMAGAMGLAAEGLITGGGPSDPKDAAAWRMAGNQPYAIRVGETWYPYRKMLGPFGLMIGAAADMYHAGHLLSEGEQTKAAAAMVFGLSEAVLNETWMSGASNLMNAARHWDAGGETYLDNVATGFIPFSSALRQVAAQIDPYAREAHGLVDKVRNQVPWLSEDLLPQRDIFGAPMDRHTMMGPTDVNNDPVVQRLEALQEAGHAVFPAKLESKIVGVKLTPQQYDRFGQTAGMMVRMHLDAIVKVPGFSILPEQIQAERIKSAITTAREQARTLVKLEYPAIPMQAMENKAVLLKGKP